WKVTDTAHANASYFIELNSSTHQLDVKGEAQTFHLAPSTFAILSAGEMAFVQPANSKNEWFRIDGGFYLQITAGGLDAFGTGHLKLGPASLPPIFDYTT